MRSPMWTYIRGMVTIRVRGERVEELINRLIARGMDVWDIRTIRGNPDASGDGPGEVEVEMRMHVSDFFRLRPHLKETGCRARVSGRKGLPFQLRRLGKRKFFAIGLLFFVAGLYLLSSLVWTVEVEGNETIEQQAVLEAARKLGIRPMQWKFRLPSPDEMGRELVKQLPQASWVGVRVDGTAVLIKVVEARTPEPRPLLSPRHLVSRHDAVVTDIFAEQGRPVVQPNARVKRGDVLISGIIGDEHNSQVVVARGKVFGLVWYEYMIEVPLKIKYKVYTGNWRQKHYAVIGGRALQVSGFGGDKYEQAESIPRLSVLHWRNRPLGIGWMTEKVMETVEVEQSLDAETAKAAGLEQAAAELLLAAGADAEIREQKILHVKTESGKVYIKALFEVRQEISKELPIVPEHAIPDRQGE